MQIEYGKHKDFPEFRIYRDGRIWSERSNSFLTPNLTQNGYATLNLFNDSGRKSVFVHRLVAETFIERPARYALDTELVVNHLNCIRDDNRVENLEWCTQRENLLHAFLYGNADYFCPVEVRNIETEEVIGFDSRVTCGRHFGISSTAVKCRTRTNGSLVFDGYQYRNMIGNEGNSWSDPEGRDVVVRNLKTGEMVIFSTISELGGFIKFDATNLRYRLKKSYHPVFPGGYQVKLLYDRRPWRTPDPLETELLRPHKAKPIQAYNPVTGEIKVYGTAVECAKAHNLKVPTLNLRVRKYKRVGPYPDGWEYSYYSPSKEKSLECNLP